MTKGPISKAPHLFLLLLLLVLPSTALAENLIIFKGKDINRLANLITIPNDQVITSMEVQQACWVPGLSNGNHYIYSPWSRTCRTYDFATTLNLPEKNYFNAALSKTPMVIYNTFMGTIVGIEDWAAGIPDYCPKDPTKIDPGICGCGTPDTDSDGDGIADCNDICPGDPNNTDSDNDGTLDCIDGCRNDPAKIVPGICGCGVPDTDSDNDGTADCNDVCPIDPNKILAGICGCGVADTDSDSDGTPDCNDACIDDPAKIVPGICGCGIPDTDLNNNGTTDCLEKNRLFFPIKDKYGRTVIMQF